MMHPADLRRASRLLHQFARELYQGHTVNGEWPATPSAHQAKRDHDQARNLATQLNQAATGRKPKGSP